MEQPLPQGPVSTEPGCTHPQCTLQHPHAGPALLDPHPVDENPEDLIGEEMPDPWSDPDQKDWPNEEIEV